MEAKIEADIGVVSANLRRPGEGRPSLGQYAWPKRAVQIDNHALLAPKTHDDGQKIHVRARGHSFAPIKVGPDPLGERRRLGKYIVDCGELAWRPLQHPARRAEMGEADQAVIHELV